MRGDDPVYPLPTMPQRRDSLVRAHRGARASPGPGATPSSFRSRSGSSIGLPDHVSFDAGVLIEPASVVLHGLEKAGPQPGESVGVIGVGTLGSLAISLLRLHSPARIVACGARPEELELALRLGADEVVLAGDPAPLGELDLVVETAGVPPAVELATQLCRPGGRAVLLGIAGERQTLTLPADLLVGKDMALIGSLAYPTSVWSRVVGLVSARLLELAPIVTHRFPGQRV